MVKVKGISNQRERKNFLFFSCPLNLTCLKKSGHFFVLVLVLVLVLSAGDTASHGRKSRRRLLLKRWGASNHAPMMRVETIS